MKKLLIFFLLASTPITATLMLVSCSTTTQITNNVSFEVNQKGDWGYDSTKSIYDIATSWSTNPDFQSKLRKAFSDYNSKNPADKTFSLTFNLHSNGINGTDSFHFDIIDNKLVFNNMDLSYLYKKDLSPSISNSYNEADFNIANINPNTAKPMNPTTTVNATTAKTTNPQLSLNFTDQQYIPNIVTWTHANDLASNTSIANEIFYQIFDDADQTSNHFTSSIADWRTLPTPLISFAIRYPSSDGSKILSGIQTWRITGEYNFSQSTKDINVKLTVPQINSLIGWQVDNIGRSQDSIGNHLTKLLNEVLL